MSSMSEGQTDQPTLEEAMRRLEEISTRLESTEIELTESLELYEEGVRLLRLCEGLLTTAEGRLEQLRAAGAGFRFEPLSDRP